MLLVKGVYLIFRPFPFTFFFIQRFLKIPLTLNWTKETAFFRGTNISHCVIRIY